MDFGRRWSIILIKTESLTIIRTLIPKLHSFGFVSFVLQLRLFACLLPV